MNKSDQQAIERITYLASLASSVDKIDADLDVLRHITVRYRADEPLSAADAESLRALSAKLEDYLIHNEPLRSFTRESLEQKIEQRFNPSPFYRRPGWNLLLIIIASAMLGSLAFVPGNLGQDTKIQLAMSLFFFGIHCGNIWFFIAALQNFRKELRLAFSLLVLGILLVGIVGAQFTLITLFGFTDLPWAKYGGFLFLFPLSYIPLLLGVYLFARRLQVTSKVMSVPALIVTCVVIPLLLAVMPNKAVAGEEFYFIASVVGVSLGGILIGWTAAIAFAAAKRLSPHYARAMKMLAGAFAIICVTAAALLAALLGAGSLTPLAMSLALSPVLIAEPLELLAGYTFKKRASE